MANRTRRATPRKAGSKNCPGEHTLAEILSQPHIWAETEKQLKDSGALEHLAEILSPRSPWLFVGCGSSYYLSRLIAALWTKHFYIPATGVPASELLFAPEETLRRIGAEQIVLMSRSGETTEVLRTAELLQSHKTVQTLGVTCNPRSPLEEALHPHLQARLGRREEHGDDAVVYGNPAGFPATRLAICGRRPAVERAGPIAAPGSILDGCERPQDSGVRRQAKLSLITCFSARARTTGWPRKRV